MRLQAFIEMRKSQMGYLS